MVFFPGGSVTPSEDVKQKYLVVQIQSIRKKNKANNRCENRRNLKIYDENMPLARTGGLRIAEEW